MEDPRFSTDAVVDVPTEKLPDDAKAWLTRWKLNGHRVECVSYIPPKRAGELGLKSWHIYTDCAVCRRCSCATCQHDETYAVDQPCRRE